MRVSTILLQYYMLIIVTIFVTNPHARLPRSPYLRGDQSSNSLAHSYMRILYDCRYATHAIVEAVLSQYLLLNFGAQAIPVIGTMSVIVRDSLSCRIYFLYNRMNQKFQSCLNSPGLWVGLYNRTVTILEQLDMLNLLQLSETAGYYMSCPSFFRDESCSVETTVSNLILTLHMVTGTLSGQTQGVLCCQT